MSAPRASPPFPQLPARFNTALCRLAEYWIPKSHILTLPNSCRRQKTCFFPILYIQEICTTCSLHVITHFKILHSLSQARRSITRQVECRAGGRTPPPPKSPSGPEGAAKCRVSASHSKNPACSPQPRGTSLLRLQDNQLFPQIGGAGEGAHLLGRSRCNYRGPGRAGL